MDRRKQVAIKGKARKETDQGPRRVRGFLEPSLLLALHYGDGYGYELAEAIKPMGFADQPVDISLIYRTLRSLEDKGLVVSHWEEQSAVGPARRVYNLTAEGDRYLGNWMSDLRETVAAISLFVAQYDRHMADGHGEFHWRAVQRRLWEAWEAGGGTAAAAQGGVLEGEGNMPDSNILNIEAKS